MPPKVRPDSFLNEIHYVKRTDDATDDLAGFFLVFYIS